MTNVKELPLEVMQELQSCACACGSVTGKGSGA